MAILILNSNDNIDNTKQFPLYPILVLNFVTQMFLFKFACEPNWEGRREKKTVINPTINLDKFFSERAE